VPKTRESYDEVAVGHKTRRYVGELDPHMGNEMNLRMASFYYLLRYLLPQVSVQLNFVFHDESSVIHGPYFSTLQAQRGTIVRIDRCIEE
jgi:hypothetical protein